MDIDINLVKKYLNYSQEASVFDDYILEVYKEVQEISKPKKLCDFSNISRESGYYKLDKLGIMLKSQSINDLFVDCSQIATLVVTLGMEIDKKIAFYAKTDMTRSMVFDAVSSVYVESVLDEFEEEVASKMPDMYRTMRFSAGYGDLDISLQKQLIEAVGADKYLGINVNSNYLMTPLKSITAFVGFSHKKQPFCDICLSCPQNGKCNTKCSKVNKI